MGKAKFMGMHVIPMFFHRVGSSCHAPTDVDLDSPSTSKKPSPPRGSSTDTIRVIRSDGRVKLYDRPVLAGELMSEFPLHLVCHSDSFCIGQKVPALSEQDPLQPGHSYFLLPTHFFQSVLSFVTIASSFAKAATACNTNPAQLLKTFDIRKTPSGALQIRVSDEFIDKIRAAEEEEEEEERLRKARLCTTLALEKDYKQLVRCKSDLWKPKLETIREAEGRRHRKGMEAFGSFKAMKKRDKENQSCDVLRKEKKVKERKREDKDSGSALLKKDTKESRKQDKDSGDLQKKEKKEKKEKKVKETQQQKEISRLIKKEKKDEKKKKKKERKQQRQQQEKDSCSELQQQEKDYCELFLREEKNESHQRDKDSNDLHDEKEKETQQQEKDTGNNYRSPSPPPPPPPPPPSPAKSKGQTKEKEKKKSKNS